MLKIMNHSNKSKTMREALTSNYDKNVWSELENSSCKKQLPVRDMKE